MKMHLPIYIYVCVYNVYEYVFLICKKANCFPHLIKSCY